MIENILVVLATVGLIFLLASFKPLQKQVDRLIEWEKEKQQKGS